MLDAIGRVVLRVILYARVSSDEQAKKGYSIGGQLDEIREYAEGQGWEVVGTETDPGYSRETLWRPGLDRVRKTVAAGGVDMVLAWKRDRFGASPVPQLLADEFAEHGTKLRSLDDSGEGYDAEFMDGIKDLMAKRELREIARRSRMGRLAKARKGEVVASHKAAYGFRFNDTKDGYELDREKMAVVGRIFRELAVEGKTLYAVRKGLQAAGIPTPTGKKIWHQSTLRHLIENDAYRPHTHEEASALVSPAVAAALDPDKLYGILWWGKRKQTKKQTTNTDANGTSYGYTYKIAVRPREEWVAIPVPNSGLPREWVDKAREAIKHNKRPSSCGRRFWELSGGILRCAACGCTMQTTAIRAHGKNLHFYYRCPRRVKDGKDGCENAKNFRADAVEPMMWQRVSDLLKSPQKLAAGLDKRMEQERERLRCNPKEEAALWTKRVEEYTIQRENRLQQHAEGLIGLGELRERLSEIDEARSVAERELERLRNVGAELARLERDKEDLVASYAAGVPERLENRTPEQRHRMYRALRIEAVGHPDGRVEVTGDVIIDVSNEEITSTRTASSTSVRLTRTRRASRRPSSTSSGRIRT